MSDYVPIYKKIIHANDVLVERSLPNEGSLRVKAGDIVEAFTEIGSSKYALNNFLVDPLFSAQLFPGKTFARGETIGRFRGKSVDAPFNGVLEKQGDAFVLVSQKETFVLLSGVWGEVVDVAENLSALIKTHTTNIHMLASTENSVEGELVVFPNPSSEMQMQYLKKYHKNVYKKILYVGDYFQEDLLEKAIELEVSGILAGSADRELFSIAKKADIFLGLFSGFGQLSTPKDVFSTLTNVSNRYVFVRGIEGLLRIPMPEAFDDPEVRSSTVKTNLKLLKKGVRVVVFSEDHFGWVGFIEKASKDSIVVKFEKNDTSVEVPLPNIWALV
ncbi:MAG: hypothetical protein WC243_00140 [Patescibacteria group bacterium]|jgi:hypothetical protein